MNITDAGYRVAKSDSFAMIVDLMNMNKVDNTLYVVIHYDIIEGNKPAGMSEIKPIWLDVDQCGFSEARAKSQTGSYNILSVPWSTTVTGDVIVMGGHIHDGGTRLIVKADGKLVCDSKAGYAENPSYISGGMAMAPTAGGAGAKSGGGEAGHGGHGAGKPHISSMVLCWRGHPELKVARMQAGQSWTVEAQYDYKQFAGATHPNGQQENVMGIGVLWIKNAGGAAPKGR